MDIPTDGYLLRIYICECDKYDKIPLYEWILREAQVRGLAGATVLRGMAGFIAGQELHTQKVLRLNDNLPVVVEIVDAIDKLEPFLARIEPAIREGLVTMEKVQVRLYKRSKETLK